MGISLKNVAIENKQTLFNMLQMYLSEFSQYDGTKFNNNGIFEYKYFDSYFIEKNRFAYFIYLDNSLIGFVMINDYAEVNKVIDHGIAEFYIAYPYRSKGFATAAMQEVFKLHKGSWNIKYHSSNLASVKLWNKIALAYDDDYQTIVGKDDYLDGSRSIVLCFNVT